MHARIPKIVSIKVPQPRLVPNGAGAFDVVPDAR